MWRLGLRVTDPETARIAVIFGKDGKTPVGVGCLISNNSILTCFHVVRAALESKPVKGCKIVVKLLGVTTQPTFKATASQLGSDGFPESDIAVLTLMLPPEIELDIPPVEFASPLRHSGKSFSVFGFPASAQDKQGRGVKGVLHPADALGLVQMDRNGIYNVERGFSGAPVWSADLGAYVGIVAVGIKADGTSWCIPSRLLCNFIPELLVRVRIPPMDRPIIHDYSVDDPNLEFGEISDNGQRELTAVVSKKGAGPYTVDLKYECRDVSPRGGYVTFITYPDFEEDGEDAYELFSRLENGVAKNTIFPHYLFTVAAIGDGGDTVLTLDLTKVRVTKTSKKK